MPLPFDPTHLTDDAIAAILADLNERVGDIAQRLDARDEDVRQRDVAKVNSEFGRLLSAAGRAAGDTVANCEVAFRGVPCSVEGIRGKEVRVRLLTSAVEIVDHLAWRLGGSLQSARVALADDVRLVVRTVDATEAHPATPPSTCEAVVCAARPLRALLDGRRLDTQSARVTTLGRKDESDSTLAEKDSEVSTLRGDNARLKLENRYLAGEPLRPADVSLAAPAPARAARRGRARRSRR